MSLLSKGSAAADTPVGRKNFKNFICVKHVMILFLVLSPYIIQYRIILSIVLT